MSKSQQKRTKKPKTGRNTGRKPRGIISKKTASSDSLATPAVPENHSGVPDDGSMSVGWKAGVPNDGSMSVGSKSRVPNDGSMSVGSKSGVPNDGSMSSGWKVEPEPGDGAEQLRSAVGKLVSQECGRIARALVDKTIAGNMTGARLVVELSGAKNSRNKPVKKWLGPSQADRWAAEPKWQGPPEGDEETGAPAFERSAETTTS